MTKKDKLFIKALLNPLYRGKHIIMIKGKIYTAKNGKEASRLFDRLTKKYSHSIPTLTYIPKEDSLILGRQNLLESFKVSFYKHITYFSK